MSPLASLPDAVSVNGVWAGIVNVAPWRHHGWNRVAGRGWRAARGAASRRDERGHLVEALSKLNSSSLCCWRVLGSADAGVGHERSKPLPDLVSIRVSQRCRRRSRRSCR